MRGFRASKPEADRRHPGLRQAVLATTTAGNRRLLGIRVLGISRLTSSLPRSACFKHASVGRCGGARDLLEHTNPRYGVVYPQ